MSPLYIICLPLLLLSITSSATVLLCPNSCDCLNEEGLAGHLTMDCSNSNTNDQFVIKVKNYTQVQIECNTRQSVDDYRKLPPLNLTNIDWIRFMTCRFDTKLTFFDILQQLNINKTSEIKFNNFGIKQIEYLNNELFKNLDDLTGVEFITTLNLNYELSADIFKNLHNLRKLNLRENKITMIVFPNNLNNLEELDLSMTELSEIPDNIKNLVQLQVLYLWNNNIRQIPDSIFSQLFKLKRLDLHKNKINSLEADVFSNLTDLIDINLSSNNISELSDDLFVNNRELKKVNLAFNNIKYLPDNLLINQKQLRSLNIAHCKIQMIPDVFLTNLEFLNDLSLEYNYLSNFSDNFSLPRKLQTLKLSFNHIDSIPDNLFNDLADLKYLYLNNNNITFISNQVFRPLSSLTTLHLEYNQISTIESHAFYATTNLEYLHLNHNGLLPFNSRFGSPFAVLVNLKELHLNSNFLNQISSDWVRGLHHLSILDLSYNNITYLESSSLLFLSSDLAVDLRHNQINTVEFVRAKRFERVLTTQRISANTVLLSNNPIECDCLSYDFINFVQGKTQFTKLKSRLKIQVDDLACVSPRELHNQRVSQLDTKSLTCSVSQCSPNCTCKYRSWDEHFIVNCSNRDLIKPPEILPIISSKLLFTLDLSNNQLTKLDLNFDINSTYNNLTSILASNNNLTSISFSTIPKRLQSLELDSNNFKEINTTLLTKIRTLKNLTLHNNPWECQCSNIDFVLFVQKYYRQILYLSNITCKPHSTKLITLLTPNDLCPFNILIYISITFSLILICLTMSLIIVYYRHQTEIKIWLYAHNINIPCLFNTNSDDDSTQKLYDAFVSYSHKDEHFIINELIPNLEQNNDRKFRLCIHNRDWLPGEWIPNQIAHSIENSHRTIVVLSKNFLESVWGKMEFRAAHLNSLNNKRRCVVIIKLEEIGPVDELDSELKAYLNMNTYIEWGHKSFWDQLRYALPHKMTLTKQGHLLSNVIVNSLRNQSKMELKEIKKLNDNRIRF